jgi:co-chaperonin GroES (HSP10)
MMLTPVLHRIILKLDSVDEVTASGIVIPKDLIKKERKAVEIGTVVAIGETAFKDYGGGVNTAKVGDRVIISQYSGKAVTDTDGQEYVVINDEDLLVIIGEAQ